MINFRQAALPALALAGLGLAIASVVYATDTSTTSKPLSEPATAPFASYIGGTGQLEPPGKTVSIGAPESGIAIEVPIKVGDQVHAGQTLFRIDDRIRKAERDQRAADVAAAQAQIEEASANLGDYRAQLSLAEAVTDRRAVSTEDLSKRRFAVKLYQAKLATARAQLLSYQAQLNDAEAVLARLTVAAPFDATILQVNVRLGEFASAAALSTPLVMLGRSGKPHVRIQVDQNDAWRFHAGAAAKAFLRGNSQMGTSLSFAYTEPYVVTKTSLTGDSTERVDTRVLEVVYTIEDTSFPAYLGQLVDVFIEAPPVSTAKTDPATSR
ncbi:MAG: biotin/lipoyl-binding protein [Azospirillaceae bacterium]|nr:biotin/lipoyl-binding protein [Azospirillaceae bacterium]